MKRTADRVLIIQWRKELVFYILVFVAGLVGAQGESSPLAEMLTLSADSLGFSLLPTGPLVASGYSLLAEQWGVSVNQVAASNGALVIALGCIMIIQAPMGVKFGFAFPLRSCGRGTPLTSV